MSRLSRFALYTIYRRMDSNNEEFDMGYGSDMKHKIVKFTKIEILLVVLVVTNCIWINEILNASVIVHKTGEWILEGFLMSLFWKDCVCWSNGFDDGWIRKVT